MTRPLTRVLAGAALAAFAAAPAVQAATWDMPTGYSDGTFHTINIRQFAADVKKATGGKIDIRVHSGASLIKLPEIKNAVRQAQVPLGEILISNLSNENPVFGVDSVPFLAASYDEARRLWAASKAKTQALFARQGIAILFVVPWPPQGIYTKKTLAKLDDLRGLKFRTYNPLTLRFAQLAGAVPTTIQAADIPQAFATGRIDAMVTSASTGAHTKAWDYLTHYYNTQAWLPKNAVIVNMKEWAKLDAGAKNAITAAAKAAEERGWKASIAENTLRMGMLQKNGVKVETPSPALVAALKKIGGKIAQEWVKAAGADGAAILKAYRQ